ncbi:MAG TPA: hypothetical protein VFK31_08375, partial [Rhodanobacteraceae bacterium]|nr:hypothetical protein [Rhodanobacteraceae bacterium]
MTHESTPSQFSRHVTPFGRRPDGSLSDAPLTDKSPAVASPPPAQGQYPASDALSPVASPGTAMAFIRMNELDLKGKRVLIR